MRDDDVEAAGDVTGEDDRPRAGGPDRGARRRGEVGAAVAGGERVRGRVERTDRPAPRPGGDQSVRQRRIRVRSVGPRGRRRRG